MQGVGAGAGANAGARRQRGTVGWITSGGSLVSYEFENTGERKCVDDTRQTRGADARFVSVARLASWSGGDVGEALASGWRGGIGLADRWGRDFVGPAGEWVVWVWFSGGR